MLVAMKLPILVVGVSSDQWFRGTRDERAVTVLNCFDSESFLGKKLKDTFDYTPTEDEQKQLDLTKLEGAKIIISVDGIKAASGGRLKFRGEIDRSTLPKGIARDGVASQPGAQKSG